MTLSPANSDRPRSGNGNTLRWLHLSDFHTGRDDHGQLQLFSSLLKHIDQRIEKQGKPDLVFITGDIADRARSEQYDTFAEEFLLPLAERVGEKTILLVPGNHDMDHIERKSVIREGIRRESPEFFDPTPCGLSERELIFPRFAAYREPTQLLDKDDWLASEAGCLLGTFDLNGLSVGILGLHSLEWLHPNDREPTKSLLGKT
uniref:Calcineurin-like phosphoesterase n=1 Tax=Candidatus Kentrum sp. UNK TaxID=2126344 RepID=A0A451A0J8_9GAMM|nr:MAG: Calcineurin-like phosphoesterase [Candidatus Kentron sp. UNK]VFK68681.1 MAG: Calcineurin-like phosphoesterase [Candidatus Kentron sp. UNK]